LKKSRVSQVQIRFYRRSKTSAGCALMIRYALVPLLCGRLSITLFLSHCMSEFVHRKRETLTHHVVPNYNRTARTRPPTETVCRHPSAASAAPRSMMTVRMGCEAPRPINDDWSIRLRPPRPELSPESGGGRDAYCGQHRSPPRQQKREHCGEDDTAHLVSPLALLSPKATVRNRERLRRFQSSFGG